MASVVIVDPISTGADLALEFIKRGIVVIKLLSQPTPASLANIVNSSLKFAHEFCSDNLDFSDLVESLKRLNCVYCVPGCETGVVLADKISEALGIPTNGTQLSASRRDKFAMSQIDLLSLLASL